MRLLRFRANSFRNIESCDISFSPGVQLLSGDNAQGKTNAVEGIYLFARGRSFRSATDKDMVKFGSDGFSLGIEYEDKDGVHSLEYTFYKGQRKRKKNGYEVKRITDTLGQFRAVLFTPDHLRLVKDSPEERRAFLNIAISQCYPVYIGLYADFKRAQDERNCLLKLMQKGLSCDMAELEAWSLSLAKYSSEIYKFRKEYIDRLTAYAAPILSDMTDGEEQLSLTYKTSVEDGCTSLEEIVDQYREIFRRDVDREIAAGTTLFGPAREDMEIQINGKSARQFASQGQQRSVVLALKHAEGDVCRDVCGEYPVYILDDVLSELDERRRTFLMKNSKDKQMIITGCDSRSPLYEGANVIRVEKGTYVSSHR